jgi:hypothetical protein
MMSSTATISLLSINWSWASQVDSPDAVDLPIKLGVALLKDSEGRIKLQVPVKGNVKDPQFDFAKSHPESALTGTIEDASSAPFAAITEVDGFTGEELRTVAFEFGFSELQDREIQKLNALATYVEGESRPDSWVSWVRPTGKWTGPRSWENPRRKSLLTKIRQLMMKLLWWNRLPIKTSTTVAWSNSPSSGPKR